MNKINKGILLAFVTAIVSGIAIFYSKISLAKIDPLVMTTSRNFYVAIIFILGFLVTGRWNEVKKIKRDQLFPLLFIGLIGGGIPFYLFFTGLSMISAQTGNIIQKTLFIWVTILSYFFLKEKINIKFLFSCLLIFIANFFFARIKLKFGLGETLVLTATLFWSIEYIVAKKVLRDVSSELVGLFRMGLGSLILIVMTFFSGKGNLLLTLNHQQLTMILVGGSILAFYVYFWYKALKLAPASLVTVVLTFSVVVGNILNGVFAGIKINPIDIKSSIFILIGVGLISLFKLTESNRSID